MPLEDAVQEKVVGLLEYVEYGQQAKSDNEGEAIDQI